MQTQETTKRLGELDREDVIDILRKIFERRQAGDNDGMMAFVAPDIVCFPETTWGFARYPRPIVGRENVREAFWQRHVNYINVSTQMHRLVIDGLAFDCLRARLQGGGPFNSSSVESCGKATKMTAGDEPNRETVYQSARRPGRPPGRRIPLGG